MDKIVENRGLSSILADPSLLRDQAYIAGEWVSSKNNETFEVRNPASLEVICNVPDLGLAETRQAIDAAYHAQKLWSSKTGKERSSVLKTFYELMMANAEDLAKIITAEMGKPISEATGEIAYGASFIEFFAEEAKRIYGETIPGHQADKKILVIKQPIGVVTSITPWNFPNAMITRKLGPALAAGCSFVAKPAEDTPLSALAIAVLAERAGIPKGVLSIVTSNRSQIIGEEFCSNSKVRKLTFTGSTEVGKILLKQGSSQVLKMSMELGGNAPFIVFDDADLDAAVEGAILSKYRNNGQTCVCANRLYVQEKVYDKFAQKLSHAVSKFEVGDGFNKSVTLGPLITEDAVLKVESHINDAVSKGAKLICGGKRHELGGNFFEPTLLTEVKKNMIVSTNETFGPVAPLYRFKDEDDVIKQANDTIFGLAAYFYAKDLSRVWRVSEALEYGMVGVNAGVISTELAPFGGVKQSGLGREGSKHGIEEFLEMKYICMSV